MIGVIGLGFVGLTTALGFSEYGFKVYSYDIDEKKREIIESKRVPFHEPNLSEALSRHFGNNFILVDSLVKVVQNSRVIFLCVGTPQAEDGKADLSILINAIDQCCDEMAGEFKTLVIKSTVPPMTAKNIAKYIFEKKGLEVGKDIGLANNPEFLREGYAWDDFVKPDRIVVGADDSGSGSAVTEVYKEFPASVHQVSLNSAEFIKYLSNCLLATMISFSNEMATIADVIGEINIPQAFSILHQDKRWSGSPCSMSSYVYPGCGYGGYCLPKDTQAFLAMSNVVGEKAEILEKVILQNTKRLHFTSTKIMKKAKREDQVTILGLSFKPNSDDVRESPAKVVINILLENGYKNIVAYDPMATEVFKANYKFPIQYASTLTKAIENAKVIVILTSWEEFKVLKDCSSLIDARYLTMR